MAKKKTKPAGTHDQAVAVAAMKRGVSSIESEYDLPKLPAGGYDTELSIAVQGGIAVGEPTPASFKPNVDKGDMLGALLTLCEAWYHDFKMAEAINASMELLANDEDVTDMTRRAIDVAKNSADQLGYKVKQPARSGAVSGKPFIRIGGAVGKQCVEIEVRSGGNSGGAV